MHIVNTWILPKTHYLQLISCKNKVYQIHLNLQYITTIIKIIRLIKVKKIRIITLLSKYFIIYSVF